MTKIKQLTKEQEQQIPLYYNKWLNIYTDTTQHSKQDIITSTKNILNNYNTQHKNILVLNGPTELINYVKTNNLKPTTQLSAQLYTQLYNPITNQLDIQLTTQLINQLRNQLYNQLYTQLDNQLYNQLYYFIPRLALYDYALNVLKLNLQPIEPLVQFYKKAQLFFQFTNGTICIIRKPSELHFRNYRLHKDGAPALKYLDGFCFYSWNGTTIPEHYGSINSEHWKPEWLLSETNAELRRILIEGLGYERLMSKLPNKLIHSDGNMELRKITRKIDIEPIMLLKVVCPSTNHEYCLRVPPGMVNCEIARKWTFGDNDITFIKET